MLGKSVLRFNAKPAISVANFLLGAYTTSHLTILLKTIKFFQSQNDVEFHPFSTCGASTFAAPERPEEEKFYGRKEIGIAWLKVENVPTAHIPIVFTFRIYLSNSRISKMDNYSFYLL